MSDAIILRQAVTADGPALRKLHAETWVETYPGLLPTRYLLRLTEERSRVDSPRANRHPASTLLVADDPRSGLIGYAEFGPQRVPSLPYSGEIYTLYVLQSYQRRGIGTALLGLAARKLRAGGVTSLLIWVLGANAAARAFYWRLGGKIVAERPMTFAGAPLIETAYGWADVASLAPRPRVAAANLES